MYPIIEFLGREFSTYGLMALVGVLLCGYIVCRYAKKAGYDDNNFIIVLLISSIGVLVGGHIMYAITQMELIFKFFTDIPRYAETFDIFIYNMSLIFGGSVFYGGLIGGMIAGFICCKVMKLDISVYSDIIVPIVPLFHCFGRIGCFLGGCCYGIESPFGFTVHENELVPGLSGVQRFPVQLLEAFLNLLLFFLLYYFLKKGMLKGKLFATYLIIYSIIRFFDEFLRGDTYRGFLFGLSTSQIISILLFTASLIFLIVKKYKSTHNKKQDV